jgi:DnaJ-domain-containing protein 1
MLTIAAHEALCARWDGPRCLDDEDKPSPFDEDYLEHRSPETEREEALRTFERSKKNWELYFRELEKMKSEGKAYKPLQEVSDRADIDAGTDTDW